MTYVVDHNLNGTGIVLGTSTDDIDVLAGAGVSSIDSVAIAMLMDDADLTVGGEVLGFSTGAWIAGNNATVTIAGTGTIGAIAPEYARGLEVQGGALSIVNDGFLMGYDTAVHLMGGNGTTSTLLNRGNVTGNRIGLFRDLGDSDSVADEVVVTNHGSMQGAVAAIAVHAALDAREVVNNRGYIYGDISLGLGNDQYDGRGGTVVGQIFLGDGNDTALSGVSAETLDGGAGLDALDFSGGPAVVVSLADAARNKGAAFGDLYSGFEKVTATDFADELIGNGSANTLLGLAGNDTLDSGLGVDTLLGGLGNDIYILATAGDTVTEASGAGTDQVCAGYSYTLSANVENLVLTGSAAINGTGNALGNMLTGNGAKNILKGLDGNDTLDGRAGSDVLEGGLVNDVYILAAAGDTVVEALNAGTDEVRAGYSYTLGANVENLALTGSSVINGTGNALGNVLTGNAADNVLKGLNGNDTLDGGAGLDGLNGGTGADMLRGGVGADALTGGLGNDVFRFVGLAEAGDAVSDFRSLSGDDDHFHIGAAGFRGGLVAGTTLLASQFRVRADNLAQDADDRFIFRSTDQTLWFDSNGSASGGLTMVADLQAGATLTSADILLV